MKNELTTQTNDTNQFSLAPTDFNQLIQFSEIVSNSGLVPKDYIGKPGNVVVAVQMGVEIGLKPMQSLQNISVINGRPSLWGDALLALVKSSNVCEYIIENISSDGNSASCEVKRKGEPKAQTRHFTMSDATKAGLLGKDNWKKYPKRMLQLRARAWALRDVFPDVLAGMQVAEEMEDFAYTQEKQVTKAPKTLEQIGLSSIHKDGRLVVQGKTYGKTDLLKELGFTFSSKSNEWSMDLPIDAEDVIEVETTNTKQDTPPVKKAEDVETETIEPVEVPNIEYIDQLELYLEALGLEFKLEKVSNRTWLIITSDIPQNCKDSLKTIGFKNYATRGVSKNVTDLIPEEIKAEPIKEIVAQEAAVEEIIDEVPAQETVEAVHSVETNPFEETNAVQTQGSQFELPFN